MRFNQLQKTNLYIKYILLIISILGFIYLASWWKMETHFGLPNIEKFNDNIDNDDDNNDDNDNNDNNDNDNNDNNDDNYENNNQRREFIINDNLNQNGEILLNAPPITTWTPYVIDNQYQPGFSNYFYKNGYMYPIY